MPLSILPIRCLWALILLLSAETVSAEDDEIQRSWDLSIGVGYGHLSNPFAASDDIDVPVTLDFSWYGKKLFFDNGELGFTMIDRAGFGLNLITTYNSERLFYGFFNDIGILYFNSGTALMRVAQPIIDLEQNPTIPIIDPPLANSPNIPLGNFVVPFDLPDRDFSFNFGVEVIHDTSFGTFNYQLSKDISGAHKGFDARVDFSRSWIYDRWGFATQLGLHWKSAKLVDYYYGVDFEFASFLNLQYQGQSSIDATVGLTVNYRLNNQWSLVGSYRYTLFGPGIDNSPLIAQSHRYNVFTGLLYRF